MSVWQSGISYGYGGAVFRWRFAVLAGLVVVEVECCLENGFLWLRRSILQEDGSVLFCLD